MNILITGASGFLGGRLIKALQANHKVIMCSSSLNEKPSWGKTSGFYKINWEKSSSIDNACENIDVVLHAAGLNAQESANDPKKAFKINASYTQRLIDSSIKKKVKSFIYLSTAHVYSSNLNYPIYEDSSVTNKHPYAESHYFGEKKLLEELGNNIDGTVIRLSNIYGVPVNLKVKCWMLLINNLCKMAFEENIIYLNNRKDIFRDFVSMSDFLNFVELIIDKKFNNNLPKIINFGSKNVMSSSKIAKTIIDKINKIYEKKIIFDDDNFEFIKTNNFSFNSYFLDKINYNSNKFFNKELDELIKFSKTSFS